MVLVGRLPLGKDFLPPKGGAAVRNIIARIIPRDDGLRRALKIK
jgi:hypothetical protein